MDKKWNLKIRGKIYAPADIEAILKLIKGQRIPVDAEIAETGTQNWKRISGISEFKEYYIEVKRFDKVKCPHCGALIKQDTEFCSLCKASFKKRTKHHCFNHPYATAAKRCEKCFRYLCSKCITVRNGHTYCSDCIKSQKKHSAEGKPAKTGVINKLPNIITALVLFAVAAVIIIRNTGIPGVFDALINHKGRNSGRPYIISMIDTDGNTQEFLIKKRIQIIGTVKKMDPVKYDKNVFTKSLSIAEYPDTFLIITENDEVAGALNYILKEGYDVLMNCRELKVIGRAALKGVKHLSCNYMSFKGMTFGSEKDGWKKAEAPGKYKESGETVPVNINSSNFNTLIELSYNKPVLMEFFADWCQPCKILEPTFNKMAEERKDDILFARIDIEKNPEIAGKYKVKNIPAMVLIVNGKTVKVQTGAGKNDKENRDLINSIITGLDNSQ